MADNLNSGQHAEQKACEFLQRQGLQLLERNYRCKQGEIDLIMRTAQQEIIFVEVRLRNSQLYGDAVESVDYYKQQKIIKTATYYLQHKNWLDKVNCRFDIIGISYRHSSATVEWIPDAFSSDNF